MDQFLKDHSNLAITVVICCTACFLSLVAFAFGAVGQMGKDAFAAGAHPKAPEAFSAFSVQFGKISVVALIVVTTVILSTTDKLTQGAIGILSGIAGYVLGGVNYARFRGPGSHGSKPEDSTLPGNK